MAINSLKRSRKVLGRTRSKKSRISAPAVAPGLLSPDSVGVDDLDRLHELRRFPDYHINKRGEVWSFKRATPRRMSWFGSGSLRYPAVALVRDGINDRPLVHRLLAETFLPNPHGLTEVMHKDLNPLNCVLANLQWCTHSQLETHVARKFGTKANKPKRDRRKREFLVDDETVREIRQRAEDEDFTQHDLAKEYGVTDQRISSIVNRKSWKWVE